jgi:thioredoxin 1
MAEGIVEITGETWAGEVEKTNGITLIYFWAPWCGHCKAFAPTYDEVAAELAGKARFARLNCDENGSLAAQCSISGTPTTVVYKDGKEVDRMVGGMPKEDFRKRISKHLG